MTQAVITAYFEDIARKFSPILHTDNDQHFSILNEDSISNNIRKKLNFRDWCLLLEESKPRLFAKESKSLMESRTFRFTVCRSVNALSDTAKELIRQQSEELGKNIFAKIVFDYENRNRNALAFPLGILEYKANFESYSSILGDPDIIGTDVEITISTPFNLHTYNDLSLWN